MKYAAVISYISDEAKVTEVRPEHRKYLTGLQEQGKLAMAGPFTDGSGALIIYEAGSPEEARELIQADPFNKAGVFVRYDVKPWNQVF